MSDKTDKKKDEDWMQKKWRPAMGWMYMLICTLDMGIFPILWAIVQTLNHQPLVQWNPLTLQGAGLFHIAMGAVLGISAFGRTQEKLAGTAANPTAQTMTTNTNVTGMGNMGGMNSGMGGGMNSGMGGGFGGSTGGFVGASNGFGSTSSSPAFGAPSTGSFGSTSSFGSPAPSAPAATGGFGSSFDSTPAPVTPGPSILPPPTITGKGKAKIAD